ncbi:regulatory-associated protein of mTOR-like isoform X1 [Lates japonicus]|uniref:Regulatory-associated protein of mTOR-like isoform X1 n=1 Tax=Lates japonicus TaxID=270547 RepID=A0AAD3NM96_LATJO|nr:regulatory-associated protein of mTOR-like isoform X1 [Lates japonicus]
MLPDRLHVLVVTTALPGQCSWRQLMFCVKCGLQIYAVTLIAAAPARYKQSLDPTVDEVKKLCTSLRRNAKEERVLFHYNGHGVPRPTVNGEIWVFNKNYTQYIPLSIYDLQTWMGSPSIFVYDCSNAGIIVKSFKQFALQREQELEETPPALTSGSVGLPLPMASCSAKAPLQAEA